jgi:hypothetical protein
MRFPLQREWGLLVAPGIVKGGRLLAMVYRHRTGFGKGCRLLRYSGISNENGAMDRKGL